MKLDNSFVQALKSASGEANEGKTHKFVSYNGKEVRFLSKKELKSPEYKEFKTVSFKDFQKAAGNDQTEITKKLEECNISFRKGRFSRLLDKIKKVAKKIRRKFTNVKGDQDIGKSSSRRQESEERSGAPTKTGKPKPAEKEKGTESKSIEFLDDKEKQSSKGEKASEGESSSIEILDDKEKQDSPIEKSAEKEKGTESKSIEFLDDPVEDEHTTPPAGDPSSEDLDIEAVLEKDFSKKTVSSKEELLKLKEHKAKMEAQKNKLDPDKKAQFEEKKQELDKKIRKEESEAGERLFSEGEGWQFDPFDPDLD